VYAGEAVLGFLAVLVELAVHPIDFLVEQIDALVHRGESGLHFVAHLGKFRVHVGEAVLHHAGKLLDFGLVLHALYLGAAGWQTGAPLGVAHRQGEVEGVGAPFPAMVGALGDVDARKTRPGGAGRVLMLGSW
jgi:hypothetical protein